MLTKFILLFSLCISAIVGDHLVNVFDDHLMKALIDNGTHAIIGGLTWTIVCLQKRVSFSLNEGIWQTVLCIVLSSLIDIDHFIAAKSYKLQDVHLLKSRPFFHNTSLMFLIWIGFFGTSLIYRNQIMNVVAWIFFAAFASHHTRDATRRGYWLYPLDSLPPINYWIYITITAVLPFVIFHLSDVLKIHKYSENIVNMANLHSIV